MTYRMSKCAPLLIGLLLATASAIATEDKEIYRWVDEEGVVHYSYRPPMERKYAVTAIRQSAASAPVARQAAPEQVTALDVSPGTRPQNRDASEMTPERLAELCRQASENIERIEPSNRVLVRGADGEIRRLDDDERLRWLEDSRRFLRENCDNG